jgi:hypothetical protein
VSHLVPSHACAEGRRRGPGRHYVVQKCCI